jgi:uncharacterized protein YwgA
MDRRTWTLLAIASADKPITPAQLQKSIFLAQNKFPDAEGIKEYCFVPYNYGPFDSKVYSDAKALVAEGFVVGVPGGGGRWTDYLLTPEGKEFISKRESEILQEAQSYLKKVVTWAQSISFNDLVAAIYNAFPEMQVNSVFRE